MNALSSNNIEPNRLRRSILGGIRYGKVGNQAGGREDGPYRICYLSLPERIAIQNPYCPCLPFILSQPVVLDLMDCDLWPEMPKIFDAVQPGLLDAILTKCGYSLSGLIPLPDHAGSWAIMFSISAQGFDQG